MTAPYTPTEQQIDDVLLRTGSDPRKLAIAYLSAQRRARDAEAARALIRNPFKGDIADASKAFAAARHAMHNHKEW